MPDSFTTYLNLTKPQVGGSNDTWGGKLNTDFDTLDALFAGTGTGTAVLRDSSNRGTAAGYAVKNSAGNIRGVDYLTGTALRWRWAADDTAEGGANAGSDFKVWRYDDAGAVATLNLTITRSTGVWSFEQTPKVGANTIWHAGNDGAASGLDADLFDGQDSSLFALLAGPTFTGTLTGANGHFTGTFQGDGAATFGAAVTITGKLTLSSTDCFVPATGTTAQRSTTTEGVVRYNTSFHGLEFIDNNGLWHKLGVPGTITRLTSGAGATYTAPTGVVATRVRIIGAGAGGGAQATNSGTAGGDTSWLPATGAVAWVAKGGSPGHFGTSANTGGLGGTGGADGDVGTKIIRKTGNPGGSGGSTSAGTVPTGFGAASSLLGAGAVAAGAAGGNAATNSGSGGAGACPINANSGGGGGSGEELELWFFGAAAASATYTIGAKGTGGAAGTLAGGDGGAAQIIVEEFYA